MIIQAQKRVVLFNSNNNYNKEQLFASEHHSQHKQTSLSSSVTADTRLSFASLRKFAANTATALVTLLKQQQQQHSKNSKNESQTKEMVYFNVKTSSLHVTQGVHHNCNVWHLCCHPNERVHVSY